MRRLLTNRSNLELDGNADALITAVVGATSTDPGKRSVVLVQAPGAFLTPWRGKADAVLAMFLGGEETGSAWADVLFGDTPPSGRLVRILSSAVCLRCVRS